MPPRQFTLVYHLVEEFIGEEQDTTAYLLSSEAMRERLLAARESDVNIPFRVIREELGI